MAARVPADDDNTIITTPVPSPALVSKSRLNVATRLLEDSDKIDLSRQKYLKYRRYAPLQLSSMLASLVPLYEQLLKTNIKTFQILVNAYTPAGVVSWTYAARVWISTWIHDLYVSNREAVRKLSSVAFSERYLHEIEFALGEYDEFLVLLSAAIRPTHISYMPEDTLFIPMFAETPNWNDPNHNYFNITNYTWNFDLAMGLRETMKEKKGWNILPITSNTLGRPSWLYDWHANNEVCSWFHSEANFNMDDITIAYIVGVACTPKLGINDPDDWQFFPNHQPPANFNPNDYNRAVPRRYYGAYEVRTYELRYVSEAALMEVFDPSKKRKVSTTTTSSSSAIATPSQSATEPQTMAIDASPSDAPVPQFRLIDWIYYYRVVLSTDVHTRSGAIRAISLSS